MNFKGVTSSFDPSLVSMLTVPQIGRHAGEQDAIPISLDLLALPLSRESFRRSAKVVVPAKMNI